MQQPMKLEIPKLLPAQGSTLANATNKVALATKTPTVVAIL